MEPIEWVLLAFAGVVILWVVLVLFVEPLAIFFLIKKSMDNEAQRPKDPPTELN